MSDTIVVGVGNTVLTDDGVGVHVVDELRQAYGDAAPCDFSEHAHGGLRLMERLVGYQRAIIIDAIFTGHPAGTVFELGIDDMPSLHGASPHDATLMDALKLGRMAGVVLPPNEAIRIVAIEVADVTTFSETFTPCVQAAVPRVLAHVKQLLQFSQPWPLVNGCVGVDNVART